jgi:hypothetical protein
MKQKIYILGIVTTLIVFMGAIFKVNHLPGAGILLTIGLITLVFLFLPLALVNHYRSAESRQNLSLYIVTWLTCLIIFMSMLFKIMHWPFAGLLLTIALPFPYIVFLPVFLTVTSKNKNFNIYNTVFVLLLLALNSVFSGLLSLNVTRERIEDSFNLSRNYNQLVTVLSQLPDPDLESPVNLKIDEVLKIVNDYKGLILKQEGLSMELWNNEPWKLRRPDARGVAWNTINNSSDSPAGEKLVRGLKGLIAEMELTPGYASIAKNASILLDLPEQAGTEQEWANRIFNDTNLAWTLIYLDGLRANLLNIKTSGPAAF